MPPELSPVPIALGLAAVAALVAAGFAARSLARRRRGRPAPAAPPGTPAAPPAGAAFGTRLAWVTPHRAPSAPATTALACVEVFRDDPASGRRQTCAYCLGTHDADLLIGALKWDVEHAAEAAVPSPIPAGAASRAIRALQKRRGWSDSRLLRLALEFADSAAGGDLAAYLTRQP